MTTAPHVFLEAPPVAPLPLLEGDDIVRALRPRTRGSGPSCLHAIGLRANWIPLRVSSRVGQDSVKDDAVRAVLPHP